MARTFTFFVACLLLVVGCTGRPEYHLEGQVLAVDRARQELTIKHGDIKGFMPAMTMPYKVKDAKLLDGFTPGDLIAATLVLQDNAGYLTSVKRTGHAALTEPPQVARSMDLLAPGMPVPDVKLTDEAGAEHSLADWRGKVVAVTFIYTRCPLPDFCPRMDRNFLAAQRTISDDAALRGRVALLSVTFDPAFDTPAVLAAHARRIGADPQIWHFATGEQQAIDDFAGHFGVSIVREGTTPGASPAETQPGALTHNLRTAILKPDGTLSAVLEGNDWTPAALLDALRHASV